jgi:hypothetical protein
MAGNGAVVPADNQDAASRGLLNRHDIQFDFPDAPAIPPTPLWLGHLLLLVAIREIGDRRPGLILPALTSREIAMLDALSPTARQLFSHIALMVERCIFGSRALSADDYAEVRSAFEQFTVPQAWQAAA